MTKKRARQQQIERLRKGGDLENSIADTVEALDRLVTCIGNRDELSPKEAVTIAKCADLLMFARKTILSVAAVLSLGNVVVVVMGAPGGGGRRPDVDLQHKDDGPCGCVLCGIVDEIGKAGGG